MRAWPRRWAAPTWPSTRAPFTDTFPRTVAELVQGLCVANTRVTDACAHMSGGWMLLRPACTQVLVCRLAVCRPFGGSDDENARSHSPPRGSRCARYRARLVLPPPCAPCLL